MMMMKSVIWWRKPAYPEETTDLCDKGGRISENNKEHQRKIRWDVDKDNKQALEKA